MAESQTAQINTERPLAFWDIESLSDIFTFVIYMPKSTLISGDPKDVLWVFYLSDNMDVASQKDSIISEIYRRNPSLSPGNTVIDLRNLADKDVNKFLLTWFCADDRKAFERPEDSRFHSVNPRVMSDVGGIASFPYMIGYNSANYDCVMMALYINETWGVAPSGELSFMPTTAAFMRSLNDKLFYGFKDDMRKFLRDEEKNIYENMLRSGLYIDAAKVNEKIYKIPLKRIMGMLGMDIFEDGDVASGKPMTGPEQLANLFAYNVSDCVKLSELFAHRAFSAQFNLKKQLLASYPDIVFKPGSKSVRIGRLKADDTSAKFAQKILCPDGYLRDIRAVSFEYPRGSGRNVLAELRAWCEEKFAGYPEVLDGNILPILDWYAEIEGKNFNYSEQYYAVYEDDALPPMRISDIPMPRTTIPYFKADGTPDRTYVNFGTGGIHGAEYDKGKYDADLEDYNRKKARVDWFVSHFSEDEIGKLPATVTIDGQKYKRSEFVTVRADKTYKIKYPKPVELFTQDKKTGKWNLNKKYAWTSDDEVDHQDFTSYYPCMLMNLKAYVNDALGEDRYVQQFENKTLFGKYMKDKSRPESERKYYDTMRDGTKLVLNAASGTSDTEYDNPIRMNNVIKSMRIIG